MGFWLDYRWTILFYSTIIILLILFRKKFDMQNRFVAMYRTKIGLKLMDRIGVKHSELVKLIAYIGIGIGFVGLIFIVYVLIKNFVGMILVPSAPAAVSLVIPGVAIPGSPITIPLISGWIALFLVILIHEFSHGVVARAHKIKVKSSGIFFLGPLMGAFVEPEEKTLRKKEDTAQYSIYAAGPFSNVLLALLCIVLLMFIFTPVTTAVTTNLGIELAGVTDNYPAKEAGLEKGMVITQVSGEPVKTYTEFTNQLAVVRPNETVSITANGTVYSFKTAANPTNPKKGYLGILASTAPKTELKNKSMWAAVLYGIFKWLRELIALTGILSLGIGLANLLPLGPVDGGRMLQVGLVKIKGKQKGILWWKKISLATLLLLVINILWPILKSIGQSLV